MKNLSEIKKKKKKKKSEIKEKLMNNRQRNKCYSTRGK